MARLRTQFQEVARRVGGEYLEYFANGLPQPAVRRVTAGHRFTLVRPPGDGMSVPCLLVPFANPRRFQIHIRPEQWLAHFLKRLGFIQEVVTGDAALDARYLLSAIPQATLREILARDRARELLEQAGSVRVRTVSMAALSPGGYALQYTSLPRGMDLLRIRATWGLPSVDRLAAFFGLAEEILEVVDPREPGEVENREALLARLGQRAAVVHLPGTDLPIWDVRRQRMEAARALGRLGGRGVLDALVAALDDGDSGVVAAAVAALAVLDDPQAASALTRLLGRRRAREDEAAVAEHADQALRALGREDLVECFRGALAGDPERIKSHTLAVDEREGMVAALLEVLASGELSVRPYAARALGLLGAPAALPALRRASRAAGMRTRLTEAAREAVDAIEARASLPRPAAAAGGGTTLPRPADPPASGSDLPRPAQSPEVREP